MHPKSKAREIPGLFHATLARIFHERPTAGMRVTAVFVITVLVTTVPVAAVFVITVLGLFPTHGGAATESACSEVAVLKVQRNYQAIQSFDAGFTQVDTRTGGRVSKATGNVVYQKPGRMRWRYDAPNEQLLVTDGNTVWLYDPLLDNVTVQPLGDLTQGTPLAFLLGVGNLREDFACRALSQAPPSKDLGWLELVPRRPIPGLEYLLLGSAPQSGRIAALLMVDTQGNTREVRFKAMRTGVSFPKAHFTFKITPDMEVIMKDENADTILEENDKSD